MSYQFHPFPPKRPHGLTLIEMIFVVMVMAVLMGLAAPSFRSLLEAQRIRAAAFDLMADLSFARSEALKRGGPVTLTRSADNVTGRWDAGWTVTADVDVLTQKDRLGSGVVLTGPSSIAFDRNGRVANATAVARFSMVDSRGKALRCVSLDPSGRPRNSTDACPS